MSNRLRIYLDKSQYSFNIKAAEDTQHLSLPQTTIVDSVIITDDSNNSIAYRILNPTKYDFKFGDAISVWPRTNISNFESEFNGTYIDKGKYYSSGKIVLTDDPITADSDRPIISPTLTFKSGSNVNINLLLEDVKWKPYYIGYVNSQGSKLNLILHGLIINNTNDAINIDKVELMSESIEDITGHGEMQIIPINTKSVRKDEQAVVLSSNEYDTMKLYFYNLNEMKSNRARIGYRFNSTKELIRGSLKLYMTEEYYSVSSPRRSLSSPCRSPRKYREPGLTYVSSSYIPISKIGDVVDVMGPLSPITINSVFTDIKKDDICYHTIKIKCNNSLNSGSTIALQFRIFNGIEIKPKPARIIDDLYEWQCRLPAGKIGEFVIEYKTSP